MPLQPKITWKKESGLETFPVVFVMRLNPYTIFSLRVRLPLICGAWFATRLPFLIGLLASRIIFCGIHLGINIHIVGIAAFCCALWRTRNKASRIELICFMCIFLRHWAGLQNKADKQVLLEGASLIQNSAVRVHEETRTSPPGRVMSIAEREVVEDEMEENEEGARLWSRHPGHVFCWKKVWLVVWLLDLVVCYFGDGYPDIMGMSLLWKTFGWSSGSWSCGLSFWRWASWLPGHVVVKEIWLADLVSFLCTLTLHHCRWTCVFFSNFRWTCVFFRTFDELVLTRGWQELPWHRELYVTSFASIRGQGWTMISPDHPVGDRGGSHCGRSVWACHG